MSAWPHRKLVRTTAEDCEPPYQGAAGLATLLLPARTSTPENVPAGFVSLWLLCFKPEVFPQGHALMILVNIAAAGVTRLLADASHQILYATMRRGWRCTSPYTLVRLMGAAEQEQFGLQFEGATDEQAAAVARAMCEALADGLLHPEPAAAPDERAAWIEYFQFYLKQHVPGAGELEVQGW